MSCQKNYNDLLKKYNEVKKNNNINNNLDKFNSMIDKASAAIACDSECQRQKKDDELKKAYFDARTNLATAPNKVYVSRQNYVVFDQGQPAYDELIDRELSEQAQKLTSYYKINFDNENCDRPDKLSLP